MITAKKSLGQNFLKSSAVANRMCDAAEVAKGDTVLEIGPGKGMLTKELLSRGAKVIAVEKDHRLLSHLEETFPKETKTKQLEVRTGDALELDTRKLPGDYKIVANIPYYITGALLEYYLSAPHQPEVMALMVQKEVAHRIVGRVPSQGKSVEKESILSISIKAYGTPTLIEKVPAKMFAPAPKVDSASILISDISRERFDTVGEKVFFKVVKAGFSHKRKVALSNIAGVFGKTTTEKAFKSLGIPATARAEDIAVDMWFSLAEQLSENAL